jgi:uncharacterized membrane protein YdjX (TVP38/TMEM64 family)
VSWERCARLFRLALGAALVLGVIAGGVSAILWPSHLAAISDEVCNAARSSGKLGVALFALAQILVALSGVLPAALLGSAAGAVYGVGYGFVLAAVSTLLGAQLSYLASRTLLRGLAEAALAGRARLQDLDDMIAKEGWRFVCLLRMSPVMPFSATSYALGLSSVSARDYMIGTLAAMPALFGYVLLGSLAQSGLAASSAGAGPFRLGLLAVGFAATLLLTLRLGQIARKAGLFQGKSRPLSASI